MRLIVKDKYLRAVFGISFTILIFIFLLTLLKLKNIAFPLIIHFDAYKGIDFLGGKMEVFGILISAFSMLLINALLANFLYNRERFLSYILGFAGLGLMILILIAASVIISIN
ncbi:MAG: hypothetical protein AAB464_00560 [Patescibacteria group bacterium]